MDTLGLTASLVGAMSRIADIVHSAYLDQSALIERHENFIGNDLPTLVAFMNDVKNSFLNSKERPPIAAESSMRSCSYYLDQLENELHRVYGPNLNQKMNGLRRVRVQLGFDSVENAYRSLRASVLLLKDLCLFFTIQELNFKQVHILNTMAELESTTLETQRILVDQYGLANRPDSLSVRTARLEPQSLSQYTHEQHSEQAYQDQVDDDSLLGLQRNLQREYPDKTVFTAVVCPDVANDQPLRMVVARALLDTGSDVNVVSEKYLEEVGFSHLITDIPEDEQVEMEGIEEQGPSWKFERKFTSRFFLYSSSTMETAEFFVTKSSDFDVLISQKQYARIARERSSAKPKLLWMPKKKRNKKEEAEQRNFERRRHKELEDLRRAYDERENRKRIHQRESLYLQAAGRAWTINDDTRVIMPTSMSGGSGEGSSSARMNSTDESNAKKLKEASIRSGTMKDGSDDES